MIRIGNIFIKSVLIILFISTSCLIPQTSINTKLSDTKIGVGETFTLSVTIDNNTGKVTVPNIDGLSLRGTSQSINMMYSSGTFKSIKTYNFTYTANKAGNYEIDNITVKINNRTYTANTVEIEVFDAPIRNNQDNYVPNGNKFDDFMNYADDIYVDNKINKTEVYLYEPIYIIQKAYTHIPVTVLGFAKIPDRTDFISYSDSSEYNSFTEIIDNKRVSAVSLKKEVLYPVKIGDKDILTTPFVFEKGGMFYDRVQYGEENFSIKVIPLPDKKGFENFSGAVGEFTFNAKVNKTNISIGEEILISIEVIGNGNTSIITMPEINNDITNYFSMYTPKIYETNWFDNDKMIGKKTKEYILVAEKEGNSIISNINFCYFSPENRSYTNIYADKINLTISGNNTNDNVFLNNKKEELNTVPIRNSIIKNDKNFQYINFNYIYFYISALIIISMIIYNFNKINNIKLVFNKNNKYKDNAINNILSNYSNNRKEYCRLIENYLINAINDKFKLNDNNISYDKLKDYIDDDKIKDIEYIINQCRIELYSGKHNNKNEDYHTKTMELIKYIKELKIKKF